MSSGLLSRQPPSTHSKFSPEASRASSALQYGASSQAASSDQDSNKTLVSSSTPAKSAVSSLVSRYSRDRDSPDPAYQRDADASSRDAASPRPAGYIAPKDSSVGRSERGYGSYLSSRFQERESSGMGSNSSGSSAGGNYHSSRFNFQTPRPFMTQYNASTDSSAQIERVRQTGRRGIIRIWLRASERILSLSCVVQFPSQNVFFCFLGGSV